MILDSSPGAHKSRSATNRDVQLRIAPSGCIFNTQDIDVHSAAKDCICPFCLPALLCIPAPWFSFGEAPFSGILLLGVVPHPHQAVLCSPTRWYQSNIWSKCQCCTASRNALPGEAGRTGQKYEGCGSKASFSAVRLVNSTLFGKK